MKRLFVFLSALFLTNYCYSQPLNNLKIIKGNVFLAASIRKIDNLASGSDVSKTNEFSFLLNTSYGRIKKNLLIAPGLGIGYNSNKTKNSFNDFRTSGFTLRGSLIIQKYLTVTNNLFYSPYQSIYLEAGSSKMRFDQNMAQNQTNNILNAGISFSPFSISYRIKSNLLIDLNIGLINLSYRNVISKNDSQPNIKTRQRSLELNTYLNNSLSIGASLLLK